MDLSSLTAVDQATTPLESAGWGASVALVLDTYRLGHYCPPVTSVSSSHKGNMPRVRPLAKSLGLLRGICLTVCLADP